MVTGAGVGPGCVAVVSAATFHTFIIPIPSFLLVGAGALPADVDAAGDEPHGAHQPHALAE